MALVFASAAFLPKWIDEHPDIPDIPSGEAGPIRTFSQQLLWLLLVSTSLPALFIGGIVIRNDILTGKTSSPGVIYGLGQDVYRSTTPRLFWSLVGTYAATAIVMFGLTFLQIFVVASEDRRRASSVASKIALWGISAVYCWGLSFVLWYVTSL